MPSYRFTGPYATHYPVTRDAAGKPLGAVEPGDEREFDQAPDQWWVPASGGEAQASGPEPAAGEPAPPGPVPAPPAVIPGA